MTSYTADLLATRAFVSAPEEIAARMAMACGARGGAK